MSLNPVIHRTPAELLRLARAILSATGSPPEQANDVAEALVGSNMAGHDSHGIQLLAGYIDGVRAGRVFPAEKPTLIKREKAMAILDGHWGWGQTSGRAGAKLAIELAAENGVGAVVVRNCHHIGRVGEYVELMAQAGMTGIALANVGPSVLAHGGTAKRLGTNPIAWAAPGGDPSRPLVLDIATSTIAGNKVALARARGVEEMAPGLFVDKHGEPTQSPTAYFDGGTLLPFYGHKGFGLGTMVEFLGGALSGSLPPEQLAIQYGNGTIFVAFNIGAFVPPETFRSQVDQFRNVMETMPPAKGFERVLAPGDPEADARLARAKSGIPVPEPTWNGLVEIAASLGLTPDGVAKQL
ncbi:MAG TPA: Ldh family oxidoreductase [Thermoflexales bacterium]|nr:Ldh family oxidoreductase [Thermoflexales bacterium]